MNAVRPMPVPQLSSGAGRVFDRIGRELNTTESFNRKISLGLAKGPQLAGSCGCV